MKIIDGTKIAQKVREEIKVQIDKIKGRKPGIAFVRVGNDPASIIYLNAKKKRCQEVNIFSFDLELPQTISEAELLAEIEKLNQHTSIDGILIQLPLPSHLDTKNVIEAISPSKDVDCFHPLNVGKMLLGYEQEFLPCTPRGIVYLLQESGITLKGKHVVIVGRSNIVGKPLAAILMQNSPLGNATVTITHSHTQNLKELTLSADILITAVGKAHFITKEMVKKGTAVIDVGVNRLAGKKIVGDVDFENVAPLTSFITPVPGGVGPMTIAMLLKNTLHAYLKNKK